MDKKLYLNIWLVLLIFIVTACGRASGVALETATGDPTATIQATTSIATMELPPPEVVTLPTTPAPTETPLPSPAFWPTPTSTPDPYAGLTIADLASRSYGGGELVVEETLSINSYFTRTLVSYPSDGLKIYGFMNVPTRGQPPYPVIIALHGYIEPAIYNTLDYTTGYADTMARAGYLVIHPNLRGYPPSDSGDNLFRVGMAVDVLNLIALVKSQSGSPGALMLANPQAIGVWGHSMGGGVSTRVITVSPDIRAAVLYGSMSADDKKNFERIFTYFSNGARGSEELSHPTEVFERISPIYYLDRIQAAVSIHHGANDADVPLQWSLDLCERLRSLGKSVECFTYEGQPHTFRGEGDELFATRTVQFFDRVLRGLE